MDTVYIAVKKGGKKMGLGRMGGPKAGGPGGFCVCPNCGYRVRHSRGTPCYRKKCPKCGTPMTRA